MSWDERTYIMIKPDGVQRGLVGEITKRFEQRGYKLQALKLFQARATSRCSSRPLCYREQRAQAQASRSTLTRTLTPPGRRGPAPSILTRTLTLQPNPNAHQADEALLKQHYKVSSCGP